VLVLVLRHATIIPPLRFEIAKPYDDVSRHAVLVLSSDALAAALLGAAVELAGHVPHFARQGEPARSALLRVRPKLVLIDCDHEESCTDEFVGPALMTGGKVLIFRSRRTEHDRTEFAERLSLRVVDMPLDHTALTTLLEETLGE
jgi:DNA-binding response OmpR family regulator